MRRRAAAARERRSRPPSSAFYERLKEVRDAHRHFPNALAPTREERDEALLAEPRVEFTGEEGSSGRFLDLHEHFRTFVNAPFGRKLDYQAYLETVSEEGLAALPRPAKFGPAYARYLEALNDYLLGFQRRTSPLSYPEPALAQRAAAFEAAWAEGRVRGWEDRGLGAAADETGPAELEAFESAEEAGAALGEEAVRVALQRLGLKAGGSPAERAARLFATKGRRLCELEAKLFVRGAAPQAGEEGRARAEAAARAVARLESVTLALEEMLREQLAATRGNVEKKSTLSWEELEAERMEEDEDWGEGEEGEAGAEAIYNPLKLPMGWDGKPIPYWLFKLHGLNQEFRCEICGNFSYWGRRAYERHFREARHQHGMRCLKVPNSKAFLEVTSISDALQLHKAMTEKGAATFRTEADEEFEDASGNVYSRKVYMDLQRQGLL